MTPADHIIELESTRQPTPTRRKRATQLRSRTPTRAAHDEKPRRKGARVERESAWVCLRCKSAERPRGPFMRPGSARWCFFCRLLWP